MSFVLDSSVALAWAFPDESEPALDHLSDRLTTEMVIVPPVWPLEIGNVLLMAVKQGRLAARDMSDLVQEFRALSVEIDGLSTNESLHDTLMLAQNTS